MQKHQLYFETNTNGNSITLVHNDVHSRLAPSISDFIFFHHILTAKFVVSRCLYCKL